MVSGTVSYELETTSAVDFLIFFTLHFKWKLMYLILRVVCTLHVVLVLTSTRNTVINYEAHLYETKALELSVRKLSYRQHWLCFIFWTKRSRHFQAEMEQQTFLASWWLQLYKIYFHLRWFETFPSSPLLHAVHISYLACSSITSFAFFSAKGKLDVCRCLRIAMHCFRCIF